VVIVQEGALKGVRGVVRERRSGRQLVIWVSEIGRGVAFTIGPALVKAAVPFVTATRRLGCAPIASTLFCLRFNSLSIKLILGPSGHFLI